MQVKLVFANFRQMAALGQQKYWGSPFCVYDFPQDFNQAASEANHNRNRALSIFTDGRTLLLVAAHKNRDKNSSLGTWLRVPHMQVTYLITNNYL